MLLDTVNRKIQAVLSGAPATTNPTVISAWQDITSAGSSLGTGATPVNLNGVTPVDIVAAPAASVQRRILSISIYNIDTAVVTCTVRYNDNGTLYTAVKTTLAVGDTLNYLDGIGWKLTDSTGALKSSGGGSASVPTGTGFRHITAGAEDAASKLVDTADINSNQVTYAKMQDVSATDKIIGRSTAGAGDPEEIACTAAGRALIDDVDAAAQRTTLGFGSVDNTTDAGKPVSTAQQTALDLKANLASPTLTGTPSLPTGTTGVTQSPADNSTKLATTAYADALGALKAALAGATFTGLVTLPVGTTALASLNMPSGTRKTTPAVGDHEFDGTAFYETVDATSGRTQRSSQNIFRLTANGAAIGPAIADYFGANSAFPFVLNGIYEVTFYLFYLKTTAGTVVYTLTNTQAYTNLVAQYIQSAVGGIATNAATTAAGIVTTTTAAAALPATASLTTAVNHKAVIRAIAECGTAGNIRLRVTSSAGTITPLRGSYYTARRLFAGNVGTFAA